MKRATYFFALLLSASFLFPSCASMKQGRWLAKHSKMLSDAANSDIPPEKKMDILASSFTEMMHQSLNFVNPKKGAMFAKAYLEQNEKSIDKITKSLGTWQKDMSIPERLALALSMKKKPYTKNLIDLYPRFRRKYKTYSTIMRISGKIGKGLIGLGGKTLGGMKD
jgi:hypothetical protein